MNAYAECFRCRRRTHKDEMIEFSRYRVGSWNETLRYAYRSLCLYCLEELQSLGVAKKAERNGATHPRP